MTTLTLGTLSFSFRDSLSIGSGKSTFPAVLIDTDYPRGIDRHGKLSSQLRDEDDRLSSCGDTITSRHHRSQLWLSSSERP